MTAAWTTPAGACPSTDTQPVGVDFASFVGLRLGDQPSTASVVALGITHNAPEHAPVLVTENQEPNDDPATAPVVDANQFIVGHVAHTGDAEYYRFSLAGVPVNSRLVVSLDNPRATDLDLTLNGPSLGAIQSNPFGATALGSTPVPDQPVAADNSQTVPQANTLSDVPFGATPWGATPFGATAAGSISQNRGDESESATMVVHASSNGMATIGVTGYNGAWSNDPNDYGPEWPRIRNAVRARDGFRCQVCGALENEGRQHDVHHKTPFRQFPSAAEANRLDNLMTLCRACHGNAEANVRMRSGLAGLASVLGQLAPLFLMCDSRDLGLHYDPQAPFANGQPAVVLYDLVPAGIGFSQKLFELHAELLARALELVSECPCEDGCPSCVGPAGENGVGGKAETLEILKIMVK